MIFKDSIISQDILQVVIPMAGLGTRFAQYGFRENKYLLPININLQLMIELSITSLGVPNNSQFYFIVNESKGRDDKLRYILDDIANRHQYNHTICSVPKLTEGPASTVATIGHLLDPHKPLVISNSDQILEWSWDQFIARCQNYDGCVLTYKPQYKLTMGTYDKHSFVRIDPLTKKIDLCTEKLVISDKAMIGVHYYKKAQMFLDTYKYIVDHNMRAPNGEFYISLTYQAMLKLEHDIGYYDLDTNEHFYPVGEPNDYFSYLYSLHGGYKHQVEDISVNIAQFLHDNVSVEYLGLDSCSFKNSGLFIHLDGYAVTTSGKQLKQYQFTNDDLSITGIVKCIYIQSPELRLINNKNIWSRDDFVRGWFIGDFEPSIVRTKLFEIAIIKHLKDEKWDYHYHKKADEINILLEGSMKINEREIKPNQKFVISKNQVTCPIFEKDCVVLCLKVPSVIGDKYCV